MQRSERYGLCRNKYPDIKEQVSKQIVYINTLHMGEEEGASEPVSQSFPTKTH